RGLLDLSLPPDSRADRHRARHRGAVDHRGRDPVHGAREDRYPGGRQGRRLWRARTSGDAGIRVRGRPTCPRAGLGGPRCPPLLCGGRSRRSRLAARGARQHRQVGGALGVNVSVGRALRRTVRRCGRHPLLVLAMALGLAAASVVVTLTRLTFEASELHLLPPGQAYVSRYREYSKAFGELDELVIVVRGQTPQESRAFAARLAGELRAGPIAFNHLAYRVALEDVDGRALLYLPTPALKELREQIYDHQAFIEAFVSAPGLVTLLDAVNHQFARAFASHFMDLGLEDSAPPDDIRFLMTLVTQLREAISHPTVYRSPWTAMLAVAEGDEDTGYFLSDDKSLVYILADPTGGSGGFMNDRAAVDEIRRPIASPRTEVPGGQA